MYIHLRSLHYKQRTYARPKLQVRKLIISEKKHLSENIGKNGNPIARPSLVYFVHILDPNWRYFVRTQKDVYIVLKTKMIVQFVSMGKFKFTFDHVIYH